MSHSCKKVPPVPTNGTQSSKGLTMSFSKIKMALTALLVAFTTPVSADAIGIGTGIGQASATVDGGKTYNLSGGGVGAANCANALGLGPVSASVMTKTCKREILGNYFAKRGNYALADQIMAGDPLVQQAMKEIAAASNKGSTTSSKPGVKTAMPNYTGSWKSLSRTKKVALENCAATLNGLRTAECAN